jgi:MFS family permease
VTRDYRILLATRVLRAFGFGFGAVLVGIHLERRHLPPIEIGVILAIALVSASMSGLVLAAVSGHSGRRRALALTGLLMAGTGLDMALGPNFWALLAAGLTGMLSAGSVDLGPFLPLEQAILTESVDRRRRNRAFARYSLTGGLAGAAGALAASLGSDLTRSRLFFLLYAAIGLATCLLPLLMSENVEVPLAKARAVFGNVRPLLGLSALFALDAFGGGLVANSVIAYWLHVHFHASSDFLGPSFAAFALVSALSYELAGWLGDRIGLINTMVLTHLPSSLILIAVAFSPSLAWAVGLLVTRNALSQMDVPVRQSYVASIVPAGQRAGALAFTGAVRGLAQGFGPLLSGLAIQLAAFGLPLVIGGAAKVAYDLGLYAGYRRRQPGEGV